MDIHPLSQEWSGKKNATSYIHTFSYSLHCQKYLEWNPSDRALMNDRSLLLFHHPISELQPSVYLTQLSSNYPWIYVQARIQTSPSRRDIVAHWYPRCSSLMPPPNQCRTPPLLVTQVKRKTSQSPVPPLLMLSVTACLPGQTWGNLAQIQTERHLTHPVNTQPS